LSAHWGEGTLRTGAVCSAGHYCLFCSWSRVRWRVLLLQESHLSASRLRPSRVLRIENGRGQGAEMPPWPLHRLARLSPWQWRLPASSPHLSVGPTPDADGAPRSRRSLHGVRVQEHSNNNQEAHTESTPRSKLAARRVVLLCGGGRALGPCLSPAVACVACSRPLQVDSAGSHPISAQRLGRSFPLQMPQQCMEQQPQQQ
jgi:hypothetical protein